MSKTIVAIGGGNLQLQETLPIDQKIIKLSGKSHPRVLFFPTASKDDQGYAKRFKQYYRSLGCEVDAIRLLHTKRRYEDFEQEWFTYDIWYLGGGNSRFLMDTLKKRHIDVLIERAYDQGIILAGYSAGANVLFTYGYADLDGTFAFVKGLGLVDGIFTPHYQKRFQFDQDALAFHGKRIGCQDRQAYVVEDEKGYFIP